MRAEPTACIISAGTRKIPLPMMVPTTMAVECQAFSSRTSSGLFPSAAAVEVAMNPSLVFANRFWSTLHCSVARRVLYHRKIPAMTQFLVLRRRQLHQQRLSFRIKPAQQCLHVSLRHGCAADGRLTGAAPDMHEDTRSATCHGRICIVVHQYAPAIEIVSAAHLFVFVAAPVGRDGGGVHQRVVGL